MILDAVISDKVKYHLRGRLYQLKQAFRDQSSMLLREGQGSSERNSPLLPALYEYENYLKRRGDHRSRTNLNAKQKVIIIIISNV